MVADHPLLQQRLQVKDGLDLVREAGARWAADDRGGMASDPAPGWNAVPVAGYRPSEAQAGRRQTIPEHRRSFALLADALSCLVQFFQWTGHCAFC
jgi:hypothetical protein